MACSLTLVASIVLRVPPKAPASVVWRHFLSPRQSQLWARRCHSSQNFRRGLRDPFRGFSTSRRMQEASKITPQAVSAVLRGEEFASGDLFAEGFSPVRYFDTNKLLSNDPIEDSHSETLLHPPSDRQGDPPSMLFGIYDGHGGASCGIVTANRLQHYVGAALLNLPDLKGHLQRLEEAARQPDSTDAIYGEMYSILTTFNDDWEMVHDLKSTHQMSYIEYVRNLYRDRVQEVDDDEKATMSVAERITAAFEDLDNDMSAEAIKYAGEDEVGMMTSTVALSGAVAVLAHIDGPMLHVASTGDCVAVLGSLSENDTWIAKKLTTDHNTDNQAEVKRILDEHPGEQRTDIFKGDRLLGMLAPLRAFGDFRFKWNRETIMETIGGLLGNVAIPEHYKTPPYLTVQPDVTSARLGPRDKFLVIGSDGLWDMMTPMRVIRLVGEHMQGKITLSPLVLANVAEIKLLEIAAVLKKRQTAMKLKPQDLNAATHLIRSALGGTAYGVDHGRLSQMLTLPPDMVRMFRDDITVTVIFFDQEYLRHC